MTTRAGDGGWTRRNGDDVREGNATVQPDAAQPGWRASAAEQNRGMQCVWYVLPGPTGKAGRAPAWSADTVSGVREGVATQGGDAKERARPR